MSGSFWVYWDNLSEETQSSYTSKHTLPDKSRNPCGVLIDQVDPESLVVIKTHNSITEIAKTFQISPKKIKVLATENQVYKGFLWRLKSH